MTLSNESLVEECSKVSSATPNLSPRKRIQQSMPRMGICLHKLPDSVTEGATTAKIRYQLNRDLQRLRTQHEHSSMCTQHTAANFFECASTASARHAHCCFSSVAAPSSQSTRYTHLRFTHACTIYRKFDDPARNPKQNLFRKRMGNQRQHQFHPHSYPICHHHRH